MPQTKDTFDSIANVYDRINNIISLGKHKKWKSNFINIAKFEGKVLDLATGTGDIISLIKDKYPNTDCTGIDPSIDMLRIARKKYKEIKFIESYAENLKYEDNYFDFVTISFGIRNTVSINDSLVEIRRVLKKNQLLLIMEFSKNNNILLKIITNLYLFFVIPFVGLLFGKFREYLYLSKSINNFYSPREFVKILEKNSFEVEKYESFNFGLVTIYKAKKL
jgi:demethylmenaquinone methyltransferase/2-methoxy-6-polyprenyl-1,4-benzoquinol methylase|tara:strand:- start:102092 stop:102754 length:663 start_codon:yes stop_codon:yes gene_type:complete